jgi:proteic killer suppression protein
MRDIFDVIVTEKALRHLRKVPLHIAIKFQSWVDAIGNKGLNEVRKIPGYHDEPLKGDRKGQRSVRLNIAYRAIYIVKNEIVSFVEVQEVHKHEY